MTPEQKEKALACETPEELIKLAKDEGYELTDEQLSAISGGDGWGCSDNDCPNFCVFC